MLLRVGVWFLVLVRFFSCGVGVWFACGFVLVFLVVWREWVGWFLGFAGASVVGVLLVVLEVCCCGEDMCCWVFSWLVLFLVVVFVIASLLFAVWFCVCLLFLGGCYVCLYCLYSSGLVGFLCCCQERRYIFFC